MRCIAYRAFDWAQVVIDESSGLRTIKNGNDYFICRSLNCADCGFLFLDIQFSDGELSELYNYHRGDKLQHPKRFLGAWLQAQMWHFEHSSYTYQRYRELFKASLKISFQHS